MIYILRFIFYDLYCYILYYIIGWTLTCTSSCCCVPLRFFFSACLLMMSERSCRPGSWASWRPEFSLNFVLVTVCLSFPAFVSLSCSACASAGGSHFITQTLNPKPKKCPKSSAVFYWQNQKIFFPCNAGGWIECDTILRIKGDGRPDGFWLFSNRQEQISQVKP